MLRKMMLMAIGAMFLPLFCSCSEIEGTWELIDISPIDAMDSPPNGLSNRKEYYSPDGQLYIIEATEKLQKDSPHVSYSFSDGKRTITTPDGDTFTTPVKFVGKNLMVLTFAENNILTYRRIEGERAYDKPIEPRSLLVIRMAPPIKQMSNQDVTYDTNDYSKLELKDKIIGVWEAISYKDVAPQNAPPYGFPNEKFILTPDGKFYMISPQEQSLKDQKAEQYSVNDKSVVVGIPKGKHIAPTPPPGGKIEQMVSFNQWGNMVWKSSDAEISLKLITRDYKNIPILPFKIALLELKKNLKNKAASFSSGRNSVSFSNHSDVELWVDRILCDGNEFPMPVGVLCPGGAKAAASMFPSPIPKVFTIEYKKDGKKLSTDISGEEVSSAIKSSEKAKEITLYFIYTDTDEFVVKIYFDRGGNSILHEDELWPDEKNPKFNSYKELVRSAYAGDSMKVQELLKEGTPFVWKNDPVSLTPLEWSVRWNRKDTFEILMSYLPANYSRYNYANCIKLAVQDEYTDVLKRLLENPKSKEVSKDALEDLFYTACAHSKTSVPLELLLKKYDVGVDYRVRDYGHTLLFVAVQSGNADIVQWLLEHGANRNVTLENGEKLIDQARDEKIRKLLNDKI